jgi:hypothetical protein
MGSKLEESLAHLRLAEEVAAEFDSPQGLDRGTPYTSPLASPGTVTATASHSANRAAKNAAQSLKT